MLANPNPNPNPSPNSNPNQALLASEARALLKEAMGGVEAWVRSP